MALAGQIIRAGDATGAARAVLSGTQSIPHNTNTAVALNSVDYDTASFWDAANTRFLVPAGMGGLYAMTASAAFVSNSTGRRAVNIHIPAGRIASTWRTVGGTGVQRFGVATQYLLAPGDWVHIEVHQESGGALNIEGSSTSITHLAIARMQII